MGRTGLWPRRCGRCRVCRSCTALRTCSAARRRTSVKRWHLRFGWPAARRTSDPNSSPSAVGKHLGSRYTGAALRVVCLRVVAVGCGSARTWPGPEEVPCVSVPPALGGRAAGRARFFPAAEAGAGRGACGSLWIIAIRVGRHRLRSSGITEGHLGDIVRWYRGGDGGAAVTAAEWLQYAWRPAPR